MRAVILLASFLPLLAAAADAIPGDQLDQEADAKVISGMSVLGNSEAPKSLYIVPWKISGLGAEMQLGPTLLDENLVAIDREVFMRELNFYQLTQ